jgi:putative membrane protein
VTALFLASLNATYNTIAALSAFMGYRAIKKKQIDRHKRFMLTAFGASCLFLTSYLTRIVLYGDTKFPGQGGVRWLYLAILISHVLLSIATVPLVLRTLFLGLNMRIEAHRPIARWAYPIWVYVSVTGVIVYLMLYHYAPTLGQSIASGHP